MKCMNWKTSRQSSATEMRDDTRGSGKHTQQNGSENIYWILTGELIKNFWSNSDLNSVKEFYPDTQTQMDDGCHRYTVCCVL